LKSYHSYLCRQKNCHKLWQNLLWKILLIYTSISRDSHKMFC